MLSIGITDLQYFSSCRRKWWLERHWKPARPQAAFWFGSAEHAGLEELYKTHDGDKALAAADTWMTDDLKKLSFEFPEVWDQVSSEFEDLYGLVLSVLTNYMIYDSENSLEASFGKVSTVEEKIRVPLFEDEKLGKVVLTGRIDLVLEGTHGVWIVDHKTSGSRMDFAGLDVDEQLTGYSYLYYSKTQQLPQGVVYNVLLKDLPAEPRVLKDGSLSKDISQKTVYSLYAKALEERGIPIDDPTYSVIVAILEAKKWDAFFQREGSTRNKIEVDRFYQRALRKARDIVGIMKDPEKNAYPSPSNYTCSYCPFLGVCKSMEDGGDWERVLEARFIPNQR